jgi:DNA-directed RNA polymerase specialized sigma24 family protein
VKHGAPLMQAADPQQTAEFEGFVRGNEPKLRYALVAAYGFEEGRDATAEAFAYAWEHWDRVRQMPNAAGYLFRVAQSRRRRRRVPVLYDVAGSPDHLFEPGLPGALAALSQRQRLVVVLVHGLGYTLGEVAELTGMRRTTVQNHGDRGMARLRGPSRPPLPARTRLPARGRGRPDPPPPITVRPS